MRKAGRHRLIHRRSVELWQSSDYRIREMFEQADVMSEGAIQADDGHSVYFGSTSIVLPLESLGGCIPDRDHAQIVQVLEADPHARVRAIRIAWREAQVRSPAALGQLRAELQFGKIPSGVKIDVDVEAVQLESRRAVRS